MAKVYHILAFVLGFTCFIVQLVLIREFLNLFMGNELVIGIMLALWMLLTATGALAGRYLRKRKHGSMPVFILLILNGILPMAGAMLAVWLRSELYAQGMMVSLQGILLISMAGLAAFCFFSGMMFTLLASALSETEDKNSISRIYAIEALGSLAGGIIFNFLLIYMFNSLRILSMIMLMNLLVAFWFALTIRKKLWAAACLFISMLLIIPSVLINPDTFAADILYPGQKILLNTDTPFGKLVATESSGQYTFYSNGIPAFSSGDIAVKEEKVHYAMCLHPEPGDVLMLSGGLDGSLEEVLKYPVERLDYVEPDPWAMEAAIKYSGALLPAEVNIFHIDPRRFLYETKNKYDLIILNTPPPNTIGNNRFYTDNFFRMAKSALNPGGIISLKLQASGNYIHEDTRLLYSTVYNTLETAFSHIRIIPGNHVYFLASDNPLHGNITDLIREMDIPTDFVNAWYLDDSSIQERAVIIQHELDPDAQINNDFRPLAAYLSVRNWLGLFHVPMWLTVLIPLLLMTFILLRLSPVNMGLFAGGFTASSAEFLLLIAFQLMYGFIYQMAGLIIMAFMGGLAFGSAYLHRAISKNMKGYIILQVAIGIFIGLIPFMLMILKYPGFPFWFPGLIISMLTFVAASLTGMQYRLATVLRQGTRIDVASSTYSADLSGSAFGIFLVAVFIFPQAGMVYTGLMLAAFNFMAAGVIRWRMKKG